MRAGVAVEANRKARGLRPDELVRIIGAFDAVIAQITDRLDYPALAAAAAGRCRVIALCAVGYDNVDLATAARLGITVTHTPDVLTEATADLAWALILAASRRLGEAERRLRAGTWGGWSMMDGLGLDVYGRTLGVVGAGRIGTAVARRAVGFRMPILYHARTPKPDMEALGARRVVLDTLLAEADIVTLHTPLTDETRGLIDARRLSLMKRDAVLVNTARGAVIDEAALIECLRTGRIAAAGLDVYAHEPKVPRELMALENVVLLPHIGSATIATRARMAEMAAANVLAVLRGDAPLNPVPSAREPPHPTPP